MPAASASEADLRIAVEPILRCPLCGCLDSRLWRTDCPDWQQDLPDQRFSYRRCAECDARFVDPRPLESELDKIYFAGYGPHQLTPRPATSPPPARAVTRVASLPMRALSAGMLAARPNRLPGVLEAAYEPPNGSASLLDFGCGSAAFLDHASARGWSTVGVDYSPDVIGAVRAAGHRGALVGELEDAVSDGSLEMIRMNHVVEHLYRPAATLAQLHHKLAPGGRIHIATPNPASLAAAAFRRHWWPLETPRHAVLYPPSTLRAVIEGAGFRNVEIHHELTSKDMARSWGTLLYERGRVQQPAIVALGDEPVRAALLRPLALLAVALRRADRVHLLARA